MKVQLLVSEWCAPCRGAEEAWRQAAGRKDFKFEVLDVGQPEGRSVVARLAIKTVPATVIDDALRHVGVPTMAQALEFVAAAPDKTAGGASYVGITLGVTGRWAIAAAAAYLVLAGAGLAFGGGIAGDAPWRPVAVHLFGLGFIGFSVFAFAEHMLPRFVGAPIRSGWLAWSQQGLVHAGIVLLAVGFALGVTSLALLGGLLGWGGLAVFASRLLPVLAHAGR